ncbi:MAG: hypothetical protein EOR84_19700 [Mesorhizobium sp.]|nr:MAG: hypothetical protein EOR84_19700 [Mesorhizobium sp.]
MSEYQYYEFQAVDHPLSEADRQLLRGLSTRARITATSFGRFATSPAGCRRSANGIAAREASSTAEANRIIWDGVTAVVVAPGVAFPMRTGQSSPSALGYM